MDKKPPKTTSRSEALQPAAASAIAALGNVEGAARPAVLPMLIRELDRRQHLLEGDAAGYWSGLEALGPESKARANRPGVERTRFPENPAELLAYGLLVDIVLPSSAEQLHKKGLSVPGVSAHVVGALADVVHPRISGGGCAQYTTGKALPHPIDSFDGLRLFLWLVEKAWFLHLSGHDSSRLVVDGGWTAIARNVGAGKSRKAITQLRMAARHFAELHVEIGRERYCFLTLNADTPNLPVEIAVGPALRPGLAVDLKGKGLSDREARMVVPILPVQRMPRPIGASRTHAAQWRMALLVLQQLRFQAERLATNGVVFLDGFRRRKLAIQAGLHPRQVERLFDAWCSADHSFLTRHGDNQFDLGPPFGYERKMLVAAGQSSIDGRNRRLHPRGRRRRGSST